MQILELVDPHAKQPDFPKILQEYIYLLLVHIIIHQELAEKVLGVDTSIIIDSGNQEW